MNSVQFICVISLIFSHFYDETSIRKGLFQWPLDILIIDDDFGCRTIAKKFLELMGGHTVDVAENSSTGLQKTAELKPDIILLDMCLPDMSGLEVLDALCGDPATRNIPC